MDSHNEGPSDTNGSNREENSDEEGEINNSDKKQNYFNITWISVAQPLQDINFSKEVGMRVEIDNDRNSLNYFELLFIS